MADNPELKTQKLIKYGNEKFGLNETTLRGILDNASGSEDLTTELDTQDELLTNLETEINSLPEASGGESTAGDYFVKVIDYDGTVLKEAKLNNGDTFTLPNAPSHDGLIFQEWSCSQEIVDNTITIIDNNVMVGAVYTTESGLSEFDIEITKVTGLNVTLKMFGTKDWGDGTSDNLQAHTYTNYGTYTIKCDGKISSTTSAGGLFGQKSGEANYYCKSVRFANVTSITASAFQYCRSLTNIIIPNSVMSIANSTFQSCRSLTNIIIPNSVTSIDNATFYYCNSLTNIIIPNSVTSIGSTAFYECNSLKSVTIPSGVTSIANSTFFKCYALANIIIPNSVTSIGNNAFQYCTSLTNTIIPNSVTSIGSTAFQYCYSLTNITIPSGVTSIADSTFNCCHALANITLPSGITAISGSAFYYCYALANINLPSGITRIGSNAFQSCYSLIEYDFSTHTIVPTLSNTNAFSSINSIAKIIVPDALYDEWIVATNWATYANYIYKASEVQA